MTRWEVFDPISGTPVRTVRFRWLAKWLLRQQYYDYDYARQGEGWLDPQWVRRQPDWQLVRVGEVYDWHKTEPGRVFFDEAWR